MDNTEKRRDDPTPAEAETWEQLEEALAAASQAPGRVMPTVERLAQRHGVGARRIIAIYRNMERRGLVEQVPGRGWVSAGTTTLLASIASELYERLDREPGGTKLPKESVLAAEYRVDRPLISEVLKDLERALVIETGPDRSVIAAAERRERALKILKQLFWSLLDFTKPAIGPTAAGAVEERFQELVSGLDLGDLIAAIGTWHRLHEWLESWRPIRESDLRDPSGGPGADRAQREGLRILVARGRIRAGRGSGEWLAVEPLPLPPARVAHNYLEPDAESESP